jgi:predicted O-methyltransferase YrrM
MLYVSYGISHLINYSSRYDGTFFSGNVNHWSRLFKKYNVHPKKILEIGTFRGDSAKFLIDYFDDAKLTCVDTWTGSPELSHVNFKDVEEEFDRFQQRYPYRVQKIKDTSNSFFSHQDAKFDLIYVDGSHFADDVVVDLINSWAVLEVGGIMICDDYISWHHNRVRDNPCAAINSFLMLKKDQYRLLAVYRQIWIQKIV